MCTQTNKQGTSVRCSAASSQLPVQATRAYWKPALPSPYPWLSKDEAENTEINPLSNRRCKSADRLRSVQQVRTQAVCLVFETCGRREYPESSQETRISSCSRGASESRHPGAKRCKLSHLKCKRKTVVPVRPATSLLEYVEQP